MSPAAVGVAAATAAVGLIVCAVGALATLTAAQPCPSAAVSVAGWDSDQVANATTVVTVGARLRVPAYGWVIAVATAITESGLRNLGYLGARNDHDSLGLFQQRPSQGWGTPAQLTTPDYAATAFYLALLRVPGWQQLPLTVAAQRVQRSAYPDAYARWEPDAHALVAAITAQPTGNGPCAADPDPSTAGPPAPTGPGGPVGSPTPVTGPDPTAG
jgi:hypothetical protein